MKLAKKESVRFRIFIFIIIEFLCLIYYYVISGITGNYSWTIIELTTTIEGFLIQIINLIAIIIGLILAVHIMM
ncbi:MAG: hypothetical protein ACFFEO_17940, partial [Candidatus Thorarchaeota archaeon]